MKTTCLTVRMLASGRTTNASNLGGSSMDVGHGHFVSPCNC
jgi:hypothetical protein